MKGCSFCNYNKVAPSSSSVALTRSPARPGGSGVHKQRAVHTAPFPLAAASWLKQKADQQSVRGRTELRAYLTEFYPTTSILLFNLVVSILSNRRFFSRLVFPCFCFLDFVFPGCFFSFAGGKRKSGEQSRASCLAAIQLRLSHKTVNYCCFQKLPNILDCIAAF